MHYWVIEKGKVMERRKRCESCGNLKLGVKKVANPYKEEIENITVEEWLCEECLSAAEEDI